MWRKKLVLSIFFFFYLLRILIIQGRPLTEGTLVSAGLKQRLPRS